MMKWLISLVAATHGVSGIHLKPDAFLRLYGRVSPAVWISTDVTPPFGFHRLQHECRIDGMHGLEKCGDFPTPLQGPGDEFGIRNEQPLGIGGLLQPGDHGLLVIEHGFAQRRGIGGGRLVLAFQHLALGGKDLIDGGSMNRMRLPGMQLLIAKNGRDGIDLAIGSVPDVILMEINLSSMDADVRYSR